VRTTVGTKLSIYITCKLNEQEATHIALLINGRSIALSFAYAQEEKWLRQFNTCN
jgi:DNA polymerase IIIc chi subunit